MRTTTKGTLMWLAAATLMLQCERAKPTVSVRPSASAAEAPPVVPARPPSQPVTAIEATVATTPAATAPASGDKAPDTLQTGLVGLSCGNSRSAASRAWEFLPRSYRLRAPGGAGGGSWRLDGADLVLEGVAGPSHGNRGGRGRVERRWRAAKLEQRGSETFLVHAEGEMICEPITAERLSGYAASAGTERPVEDAKTPSKSPKEAREKRARRARKGRTKAEEQLRRLFSGQWDCWGSWIRGDVAGRYGQRVAFTLKLKLADGLIYEATAVPDSEVAACMLRGVVAGKDGHPARLKHEGDTLEVPVVLQGRQ